MLWTRDQVVDAWKATKNQTLPVFTRHVATFSELASRSASPSPTT